MNAGGAGQPPALHSRARRGAGAAVHSAARRSAAQRSTAQHSAVHRSTGPSRVRVRPAVVSS
eukprot:1533459-Lingulodinium_polyedra.AAC.1